MVQQRLRQIGSESTGAATDITVNVNGTDYNFSEEFATSAIPVGYSETTKTFNGEEHKFVANEAGVTLGYLVDASGEGKFSQCSCRSTGPEE